MVHTLAQDDGRACSLLLKGRKKDEVVGCSLHRDRKEGLSITISDDENGSIYNFKGGEEAEVGDFKCKARRPAASPFSGVW